MGTNELHLLTEIVGGGWYMVCVIILTIVLPQEFYAHHQQMIFGGREIGDAAPPYSPTNVSEWEPNSPFASS